MIAGETGHNGGGYLQISTLTTPSSPDSVCMIRLFCFLCVRQQGEGESKMLVTHNVVCHLEYGLHLCHHVIALEELV